MLGLSRCQHLQPPFQESADALAGQLEDVGLHILHPDLQQDFQARACGPHSDQVGHAQLEAISGRRGGKMMDVEATPGIAGLGWNAVQMSLGNVKKPTPAGPRSHFIAVVEKKSTSVSCRLISRAPADWAPSTSISAP